MEAVKTTINLSLMEKIQPSNNTAAIRINAKGQISLSRKVFSYISLKYQDPVKCSVFISRDGSTIALKICEDGAFEIIERGHQYIVKGVLIKNILEEKKVVAPCRYMQVSFDEEAGVYWGKLEKGEKK